MYRKLAGLIALLVWFALTVGLTTQAFGDDFYKGKAVRVIVPHSPGGGTDMLSRLLARHMGKHIPGKPIFIVQNVTGAGGVVGIAYVFNASPDGLTIGNFDAGLLTGHLTGALGGGMFDLKKARYIGNPFADNRTLFVRADTGIKDIQQLKRVSKPLNLGGTAKGSSKTNIIIALQKLGGFKMKAIVGYRGTSHINAAVERGELDGSVMGWINIKSLHPEWVEKNTMNMLVQSGAERHPDLPNVPLLSEVVPPDARTVIKTIGLPFSIAKPYFVPPGTPNERVQTLRRAFAATMKDPEFLADAKRLGRPITPTSGAKLQATVESILDQPPEVVEQLKEITGG